ncbi:MAG: FGGY-family carbohydrate kinase [Christensenella sp.]|nr:FGGY-family carbohydrate kinase [Christensenella sp.]
MAKKYYIGLDNGGSISKAGLFDVKGNEIAVASVAVPQDLPQAGFVQRDTRALYEANAQCIRKVMEKSGIDPVKVAAVSVTGHGNGLYLVGRDEKPSYPGIISTDTRAAQLVEDWKRDGTFDRILPSTRQSLWAGQMIPLIAWFKRNQSEVLERSKYALSCTDAIRYFLTGEAWGEITNMSSISAMNLEEKRYDEQVLRELGVEDYIRLLPPVRHSADVCGRITRRAAQETGLREGTPVAGGLVDFAACPVATGIVDDTILSIVGGTWAITCYMDKKPMQDRDLFMSSIYTVDGFYNIMEGSMTSASNLEWFIQKILQTGGRSRSSYYEECNELVGGCSPEDCRVVFLPYLYGTNVNPKAKACFIGLTCMDDKASMLRALYEGVVFSTYYHIEKLMRYKEGKIKAARIAGGPSNSRVWVQMFADTLQMPIEVCKARELGTLGAAMCAAVADGEYSDMKSAARQFYHVAYTCVPKQENQTIYQKKYHTFKKMICLMDDCWKEF